MEVKSTPDGQSFSVLVCPCDEAVAASFDASDHCHGVSLSVVSFLDAKFQMTTDRCQLVILWCWIWHLEVVLEEFDGVDAHKLIGQNLKSLKLK